MSRLEHDDPRALVDRPSSTRDTGAFTRIQPWIQAARPVAHPMILVPLLIGQGLAYQAQRQFSWMYFLFACLFGVLYQVYLLYLNDVADETVDRTNDRFFLSGGSRVLPEGKLQARDLLLGARLAFVALAGLALGVAVLFDRPWFPLGAALAVVLCWAYNARPLKLSYRGHGEILQGLGCGVLLPLIGFYLQQGSLDGFPWSVLLPLYLVFHAGNIITALPDTPSDSAGGKNTVPVRHGEGRARRTALTLLALAYGCVVITQLHLPWTALAIMVVPAVLILAGVVGSGMAGRAGAAGFAACKQFVTWVSASQAWLLCAWIVVLFLGGSR